MTSKITPEKWVELEQIARAILKGKASPLAFKPKPPKTIYEKYGAPKIDAILADLADTPLSHNEIASRRKVPYATVKKLSQKRTKDIGGGRRLSRKHIRDPKRKTGFFTEGQINFWLALFEPRMRREAASLWNYRKVQAVRPSPEDIVDFLKDRLRWYLETFSPDKKLIGKTLREKIARYCNTHIRFGLNDIFREAERKKAPSQMSLFHESTSKRGGQSIFIDSLEGKSATTGLASQNPAPQKILGTLRANGLNENQSVLVFAKIAGMQNLAIARTLGISHTRIQQLFSSIEKKYGLPVINPKLSAAMRLSRQRRRK